MNDINIRNIGQLEKLIGGSARIAVTAHMKPDGDAIGSCAALYHFLRQAGKEVRIVLPDRCPDFLSFISGKIAEGDLLSYDICPEAATKAITGCDLLFCMDFNSFSRTGGLAATISGAHMPKILVDHHLNPDRELFTLSFSETEVSSTAEYLYHILMETSQVKGVAGRLPAGSAEAIMTGMTTDTNNFANSVYPSTLKMASELLGTGVDRDNIISCLYNCAREERIRLEGLLLSENLRITDDGAAYMILDRKTMDAFGIREGETEGFVNIPLTIGRVRMSFLFKEDTGKIRVSIRSKRGVSANRCASAYFNGGGHELAAGGSLAMPGDIGSIEEVAAYVEKVTHLFLNQNQA